MMACRSAETLTRHIGSSAEGLTRSSGDRAGRQPVCDSAKVGWHTVSASVHGRAILETTDVCASVVFLVRVDRAGFDEERTTFLQVRKVKTYASAGSLKNMFIITSALMMSSSFD